MRPGPCFAIVVFLLAAAQAAIAAPKRVGTFDRQVIVIAFYRSPLWRETLEARRAALAEAERANDEARIQELNAWGEESQALAHRQLEGDAPIANILEALKPAFEEIDKAADVSEITAAPPADPTVEAVDVTERLLEWLKADETTRRFIRQLYEKRSRER